MGSQKDVVNKLIPADDLYWDDIEKKYIALSEEEIENIMLTCINNSIDSDQEITQVLNWCTSVRVGELLMKNFLNGTIAIDGIDKDGEPFFVENREGNR